MQTTTIMGSPRMKGNTATVLRMVETRLTAANHVVQRFNVAKMQIHGCLGCFRCQQPVAPSPACVQQDELERVLHTMIRSEAVVYATPNYGWGPTSQLKALLDRHLSLLTAYGTPEMGCHLEGRKLALLVTSMGPREDNSELLERPFEKLASMMRCQSLGTFLLSGTMDPDTVSRDAPILADRLYNALVGSDSC